MGVIALSLGAVSPALAVDSADRAATIEGRVFNASNGVALGNVQVTIQGELRTALTDSSGRFLLSGVQPGTVQLKIDYIGMESQTLSIEVPVGGAVTREIELNPSRQSAKDEVVQLEKFEVLAAREISAQAIASNERRSAANIKDVVSFDQFGERGSENIGEFLKFLPGVSLEPDGAGSYESVSVRGIPASNVGVLVDGTSIAGASLDNSRAISLRTVPMANVSRVEVTKVPTPDLPASNIGGTINLISASPFDKKKADYSYQTYLQFSNDEGITLNGTRRWQLASNTSKYTDPSIELRATVPVNDNLAINAAFVRTYRQNVSPDEISQWDLVTNVFNRGSWAELTNPAETISGQMGVDWRITKRDIISFSFNQRKFLRPTTRSIFGFNFGSTGAVGDSTFAQSRPGSGSVSQGDNWRIEHLDTRQASVKYRHIGSDWELSASAAWSDSTASQDDVSAGFFAFATSTITGLTLRGDGIGEGGSTIPTRFSATNSSGAPVDVYDGANYSLVSGRSLEYFRKGDLRSGKIDLRKEIGQAVPITVRVGASVSEEKRDARTFQKTWNFRPNGASDVTSRKAGNFDLFDEAFLANPPSIRGTAYRPISHVKVYDLFQQHPDWFVLDQALQYQTDVQGSRYYDETISAGYLRLDARFFNRRLWIATGVRYEKTDGAGEGPLDDVNAQYQRDASGNFIRNASGQKILITTDTLERNKLRYYDRGAKSSTSYGDLYPSLNATYDLNDNWLIRVAYAKTVGRPNVNFITPGVTITDPDVVSPRITLNNPDLKPWTADNFDITLERYNKDGVSSIGVFRKNITDFFGNIATAATPALLAQYGLDEDLANFNYTITTTENVGDAHLTGVELSFRQSLTFLPHWARGLQVFATYTKLKVEGSKTADFEGFSPETGSAGFSFVRGKFFLKGNWSYQSLTRTGLVAAGTMIPVDTYLYYDKVIKGSLSTEYAFSRRFSVYAALSDLKVPRRVQLRWAENTPDYARPFRNLASSYATTIGVKGKF